MNKRISRVWVHRTSRAAAILYCFLGLVFLPFTLLAVAAGGGGGALSVGKLAPLPYGAFVYIFTALSCWLCNLAAKRVGGAEYDAVGHLNPL